ncbi:MAG TPA: hypothetical protein VMU92_12530 [Acidobacteriaceae bacterium]|nr:hypothetical protein [Acidobacteriaceae bacterium]
MIKSALVTLVLAVLPVSLWALPHSVQVDPPQVHGSRPVESLTEKAVVRDYLQSWQSLRVALDQNQPQALDLDFVGTARTKLTQTVKQQSSLGIHTRYRDQSHHLQIVFYSPDGRSIQLIDDISYEEQVLDHKGQELASRRIKARYLVVLTPAAARWQVRIFQAGPQT